MKTQFFAIAAMLSFAATAFAADHLDAPALDGMGQVDVNDLFAFQSPNDPANTVLVLTVNPFAGVASPTDFGTDVNYEFLVDNDGDAAADITYRATFAGAGIDQTFSLTRSGTEISSGGVEQNVNVTGGGMALSLIHI